MDEHPNAIRTREAYDAFARGDLESVKQYWADDVVWHIGGQSPLAGDYKGQEEIFGFFGKIFELSGGTLDVEVQDILANDEHVTVLVSTSAERDGNRLTQNGVHVMHVQDGLTKEFWSFEEDQRAGDEFWS